jgi:hypothetical protein
MLYLLAFYYKVNFRTEAVVITVLVFCRKYDLYQSHLGQDEIIRSAVETLSPL